jgi:hypothetical protein
MADELPLRAMCDVCWSFVGEPFVSREEFDSQVREYQIAIRKRDSWRPKQVIITAPQIAVRYMCWQGNEQVEPILALTADNGKSFTAGELLFELHNAVVVQLREIDHHFFEGLSLAGWLPGSDVPHYRLRQGS